MSEEGLFDQFMHRVRDGDEDAAAELVRQFEPLIRRLIRMRARDPRLQRVMESGDVCQSVLCSFFVRANAGQFELSSPDQLRHLLLDMAKKKLASAMRRHYAQRRDGRRQTATEFDELALADGGPTPSRAVAGRELLGLVRMKLGPEERQLAELRAEGRAWAEIAAELGGTANGRRMQLVRALDRIMAELGFGDEAEA